MGDLSTLIILGRFSFKALTSQAFVGIGIRENQYNKKKVIKEESACGTCVESGRERERERGRERWMDGWMVYCIINGLIIILWVNDDEHD